MVRDKKTTSRIMSSIKSKNTNPEILLGKKLWELGLRYRKHYHIVGRPDFVFVNKRIAIFCDGDFWHGNNWRIRKMKNQMEEFSNYSKWWVKKIKSNIARDKKVNKILKREGWLVLRFWESAIKKIPDKCAKMIFNKFQQKN